MSKFLGSRVPFYYGSYQKIIAMFSMIFNNIHIDVAGDKRIAVPLIYSPKEKFLSKLIEKQNDRNLVIDSVLPRMGFEDLSMAFGETRGLNAMETIKSFNLLTQTHEMMNRIPYEIDIDLTIAAKEKDHGMRIIEQIIPSFNPSLTVTINDINEFNLKTDIHIRLNSVSQAIDYLGGFNERRALLWTLSFTVEMYFYCPNDRTQLIKHAIMNMTAEDVNEILTQVRFDVIPETAERNDPHEIKETVTEGIPL